MARTGMPTLLLMRHAEAAMGSPGGGDHDRPLTAAGMEQAARTGAYLKRQALLPDIALVSSAVRTRQTYEALALPADTDMHTDRALYGAEPDGILDRVRTDAADADTVLVVCHNPGVAALAAALAGPAGDTVLRSFGTATVAVFDFAAPGWAAKSAVLRDTFRPTERSRSGGGQRA